MTRGRATGPTYGDELGVDPGESFAETGKMRSRRFSNVEHGLFVEFGGKHVSRAVDAVVGFVDEEQVSVVPFGEKTPEIDPWIEGVVVISYNDVAP